MDHRAPQDLSARKFITSLTVQHYTSLLLQDWLAQKDYTSRWASLPAALAAALFCAMPSLLIIVAAGNIIHNTRESAPAAGPLSRQRWRRLHSV